MIHEHFYSVVLSQILGMYLVIMSIIFVSRAGYYKEMLRRINPHSFGLMILGSVGLLLGLFLVTIHTISGKFPLDLISVISWIVLTKSILLLSFPERMVSLCQIIYGGKGYYIMVIIYSILGIILMANGYYLYM